MADALPRPELCIRPQGPLFESGLVRSLVLLLASVALLSCEAEQPPAPDAATPLTLPASPVVAARPNFVLIVVDTLRLDRLGFAGYAAGKTTGLDALQAESVWFENAYATSSWTLPSTASIFTSQQVSSHRVSNWGARLRPSQPIFVDALDRAGYRTGMWTANRAVAGRRGFGARFDHAELVKHPDFKGGQPLTASAFGRGETIANRALAWLEEGEGVGQEPFFAYLHFMEPHGPYLCGPAEPPSCEEEAEALNRRILDFDWALTPEEKAFLGRLYDANVARMDAVIVDLLKRLDVLGVRDDTWIILVSDHGELLGEEEMYAHGRTLFEAMVHVPFLIRGPGVAAARVETPVSLLDVGPTVLDLAGLDAPETFEGKSLRGALEGRPIVGGPIISELLQVDVLPDPRRRHVASVRDGKTKYLLGVTGEVDRFDLRSDPESLMGTAVASDAMMAMLSRAGVRPTLRPEPAASIPEATPEMRENLKALGYLR